MAFSELINWVNRVVTTTASAVAHEQPAADITGYTVDLLISNKLFATLGIT